MASVYSEHKLDSSLNSEEKDFLVVVKEISYPKIADLLSIKAKVGRLIFWSKEERSFSVSDKV